MSQGVGSSAIRRRRVVAQFALGFGRRDIYNMTDVNLRCVDSPSLLTFPDHSAPSRAAHLDAVLSSMADAPGEPLQDVASARGSFVIASGHGLIAARQACRSVVLRPTLADGGGSDAGANAAARRPWQMAH